MFPGGWERQDEQSFEDPEILASFAEPLENADDKFHESVLLLKLGKNEELVSPSAEGYQEIARSSTHIAGQTGVELIFDAIIPEARDLDFRFMALSFVLNDSKYALLYTAERSKFERYKEVVRHMADNMSVGLVLFDGLDLDSDLSEPGRPEIASDGERFLLLTCMDSGSVADGTSLMGRLVNADWSLEQPFIIQNQVDECEYASPRLIFDGANYIVAYSHSEPYGNRIYVKRISDAGIVLDADPIEVSQNTTTSAYSPEMAFDGSRTLIVWSESLNDHSIRGNFLSADGSTGAPFTIHENLTEKFSGVYSFNYAPKVAYGENRFLVAWSPHYFMDGSSDAPRPIVYQLLDLDGNLLLVDPGPTVSPRTAREDSGVNPRYAQVVFSEEDFYISWIEGSFNENNAQRAVYEVRAQLVNPAGYMQGDSELVAAHQTSVMSDNDFTKDFLRAVYHGGEIHYLWATANSMPEMGVWGVKAEAHLSLVTETDPAPIVATQGDTVQQFMNPPAEPNVAFSDTHAFYVWSSRDGVIEGWFKPLD